jgi:hypothetical protein
MTAIAIESASNCHVTVRYSVAWCHVIVIEITQMILGFYWIFACMTSHFPTYLYCYAHALPATENNTSTQTIGNY